MVERAERRLDDVSRIGAGNCVGAHLDRDWPFGIFAQGDAGNAQRGGFFLNAAGIGQDQASAAAHC